MSSPKLKEVTEAEKEEIEKKFIDYLQKNREALIGEFVRAIWRGITVNLFSPSSDSATGISRHA